MPTLKEATAEVTGAEWVKLLFEITRRLIQFETIEEVVPSILELIGEALPLRTAVLISDIGEGPVVRAWRPEGVPPRALESAEVQARRFYREHFDERDLAGTSRRGATSAILLRTPGEMLTSSTTASPRFLTLPLAIRNRPVFGTLQIETSAEVDENHLTVLSTVANHLALALDRFAASRREVRGREHAQFLEHQAIELLRREEDAHAKAAAAIRTRDQFLAVASHDLNDLMTMATLSSHKLLNTSTWDQAGWRQQVDGFVRSIKLMRVLLKDLIDTAAMEKERIPVFPEPRPVPPLVVETIDVYRALAARKHVAIRSGLPIGLPFIWADARRFEQILGNLLKNAIAFSPVGSTITIQAEHVNDQVRFQVIDQGSGIPPEQRELIFRRSWRGAPGRSKGHGLGLFIAKTLVEGHGGRIGIDAPDHGSTFWFTIPAASREDSSKKSSHDS